MIFTTRVETCLPYSTRDEDLSQGELLKRVEKQSGIFCLSEGITRTIEQENSDKKSGDKLTFYYRPEDR